MQTKTAKITRQSLPTLMAQRLGWGTRCTKYLYTDKAVQKMHADPLFSVTQGTVYEVGGYRLREIGAYGSQESGVLERVIEVTQPTDNIDLLAELCEDTTGPLGDKASPELRERFDRLRFEFEEYALIGAIPRLMGSKKRREQIRTINYLARSVCGTDRALAKLFATMLADNIENLEPSETL